jgi:hypothetical protein
MNIMDLKQVIDQALERGIRPDTEVVIGGAEVDGPFDWACLSKVYDPTAPENDDDGNGYIWFTLELGEEADPRFTPCHF